MTRMAAGLVLLLQVGAEALDEKHSLAWLEAGDQRHDHRRHRPEDHRVAETWWRRAA